MLMSTLMKIHLLIRSVCECLLCTTSSATAVAAAALSLTG